MDNKEFPHTELVKGSQPSFEHDLEDAYALRNPLLATCGLYCGACYHYRASFPDGAHLLTDVARGGRPLEGFTCRGCRSERLYIHSGCAQCALRDCADAKGVAHCGLCDAFPCKQLRAFQYDGRKHHRDIVSQLETLTEIGSNAWLAQQERHWKCACGTAYSWYEEACHPCGALLDSYFPDVKIDDA